MRVNIRRADDHRDRELCPPSLPRRSADEDAENSARALKVLADPARLRLLSLIQSQPDREACVCHLTDRSASASRPSATT